jgi:hypothetical protein
MRFTSFAFTTVLLVAAIAVPAASAKPTHDPPAWRSIIEDAGSSSTPAPGTPTWPADPQPIATAVTQPAPSDDGFPWQTVGLILVVAGIGLAGAVAVVRVRRRPHVAA